MRRWRPTALILLGLFPLLCWAADPQPSAEELERSRKLLDKWRTDPEHLQRLQRDLKAFNALPKKKQKKLRELDRTVRSLDPAAQQRLLAVLERYADWFEQLPEADRKRVEAATDSKEKLRLVQEICDRQWTDRMPLKDREELLKLPADQRGVEIARLRKEERERRLAWQKLLNLPADSRPAPYRPKYIKDFQPEVVAFLNENLMPVLSSEEKEDLTGAEGNWPGLALTVLDLAERHPVLPPPHPRSGATTYKELPFEYRRAMPRPRLDKKGQWAALLRQEGRWPDYALAVTDHLRREGKSPSLPLGASQPRDFSPAVQQVLKNKLSPALSQEEAARLQAVEGKWPEYPRVLLEQAQAHQIDIPGMTLPGPKGVWEAARAALPEVPDRILRDFAMGELTDEERSRLNISLHDPSSSRDRLKQAYFRKHPKELKRMQRAVREP